jgi:hypothetical protein
MKTINITALFLVLVFLSACDFQITMGSVEGNGNVTKEDHFFTEKIDQVKVSNGMLVELVHSQIQVVSVEADENLHEYIETELINGTLYVKATKNIRKAKSKKVTIAYVDIESIHASSGSNVKGFPGMVSEELDVKASSGAQISLNVLAKELSVESSSGSNISIKGQARNFNSKALSGSSIDARELQAIYCTSKASSGANITLNIQRSLDAKASSGGDIKYYGEPEVVTQNASSSGRVRKM